MTGYILPCNLPNFDQSAPRGEGWRIASNDEPQHAGVLTWLNPATGESVVCPSIWYNLPAVRYAVSLRYDAERNDESAVRKDSEGMAWSAGEAVRSRRQARRLRAMALLCDRNPAIPAGNIDFRGLSDPITPPDVELATVEAIEAGR
ncbi:MULTISPECIES: hypothetical protein [Mesorhizobium]|uniref:hypothetical protein n=1 Tax=Mesorhizobium TaxID=68287 RepID=UPI0007A93A40|nr:MULTISPECIES: hypothetical protein [Mesorhizobium]AMX93681.1 hypothetical protein A4R28_11510 [Mesorhizobium ciceri]MDF3208376.1 hypothetical protein [Mesorhizobium sp. LMG15046]MDF3229053.1 hypothetical protein [Mesorhizobium sp. DSM 30133]RUU22167.1 hypothetical protein EOC84_03385 [Mesorhizobium sp. Primo-B]RUU37923.1 hypothetical protein EOC83_16830 [Mesorhizobium sp. Primo-A]